MSYELKPIVTDDNYRNLVGNEYQVWCQAQQALQRKHEVEMLNLMEMLREAQGIASAALQELQDAKSHQATTEGAPNGN